MASEQTQDAGASENFFSSFVTELVTSPLNLALLGLCGFLLYKIIVGQKKYEPAPAKQPELPKLEEQDMTLEQLREYDGKGEGGRILLAVNGNIYDVTRGKRFYGPGGPYGLFAGRDASRALATFSMSEEVFRNEYDDLSDLTSMQMESVREWEMQMKEKYEYVGRLLKPGEQPRDYSQTEQKETEEPAKEPAEEPVEEPAEKTETEKKTD